MLEFIKKNYKYAILFISYLVWFLIIQPTDYDEIWNYGFSYNMAQGYLPYKDFNMVLTPFFNFLISLLFHLFGKNILIFHIEGAIIFVITMYLLFKLIKDNTYSVIAVLFGLIAEFYTNYNFFIFTILLLIIYLEKRNKNYDLLLGILVGIEILSKQTVGLFMIIPLFLIAIKDKKNIIKRLIGLLIPLFIFIIYLVITNTYKGFIDLCILGLFDFSKNNTYTNYLYLLVYIVIIITSIYICIKNKENKINYYVLSYYTITLPEFDLNHITLSLIGFLVLVLVNIKIDKNITHIIKYCSISIIVASFILSFIAVTKFDYHSYPNHLNNFEYKYIDNKSLKVINKVQEKINLYGIDNIIFLGSAESYMIKIMNNQKIDYIDLINKGNWGYNSHNKQINYIKNNKDKIYFIDESYLIPVRGNQLDKSTLRYVINHAKKIDKVENYGIYKFTKEATK